MFDPDEQHPDAEYVATDSSVSIDQLRHEAKRLMEIGRYPGAEQIYRQITSLDPSDDDALYCTVMCIAAEQPSGERYQEMQGLMEQSLKAQPDNHQHRLDYTNLLMHMEQHVDAMKLLSPLIEADPENPAARLGYGYALASLGMYDAAEIQCAHALELQPGNPDAHHLYALMRVAQNLYDDETYEHLRFTWEHKPGSLIGFQIAEFCMKVKEFGEANKYINLALPLAVADNRRDIIEKLLKHQEFLDFEDEIEPDHNAPKYLM
jgi:tetratricopeptide (TPR) repeat protein